jgi:hypothetical protein
VYSACRIFLDGFLFSALLSTRADCVVVAGRAKTTGSSTIESKAIVMNNCIGLFFYFHFHGYAFGLRRHEKSKLKKEDCKVGK